MKNYLELKNICGVYAIINKIDGKKYIGSSNNIYSRFARHRSDFKYKKQNPHFQRSWDKYGCDNFELVLVEECNRCDLIIREKFWIEFYKACNIEYGYNINPNPEKPPSWSGKRHTEETKRKISESNKGRKISEEQKKMISKVHKGKAISEKQKLQLSDTFKGEKNPMYGKSVYNLWVEKYGKTEAGKRMKKRNKRAKRSMTGKLLSDESKRKISEKLKGRKMPEELRKKHSKINLGKKASEKTKKLLSKMRTGEKNSACKIKDTDVLKIKKRLGNGESVTKIAKEYNVSRRTIYNIKNGKRKVNPKSPQSLL